jgi:ATP-dependent DNA helicase RecG
MEYPETESSTLEFKERVPSRDQILKTVIGFCNLYGGRLLIGIADSGAIVGVEEAEIDRLCEYLDKSIYESCSPPILPDIHTQRIDGKLVLVVKVSPGMQKPYFMRSEGMAKGVYIRLGKSTMRADPGSIEELQRQNRRISYDCMPAYGATPENLDTAAIAEFLGRKGKPKSRSPIGNSLLAYHLAVEEQSRIIPTIGGVLLFHERPQKLVPECFIICSRFAGKSGRTVLSTIDAMGSLFQQFETAYEFILNL